MVHNVTIGQFLQNPTKSWYKCRPFRESGSQESAVLYFQQQQKVTVHYVNNTNINAIEI